MGQPVKLSDSLVEEARDTSAVAQRSIAGQIEFWAGLGRAMESILRGREALALRKAGASVTWTKALKGADSPSGRKRVAAHLDTLPYPHFEPAPDRPGCVVRVDADGTRTVGRFVKRRFQPVADAHAG